VLVVLDPKAFKHPAIGVIKLAVAVPQPIHERPLVATTIVVECDPDAPALRLFQVVPLRPQIPAYVVLLFFLPNFAFKNLACFGDQSLEAVGLVALELALDVCAVV
jgi:hypothetical protein